MKKLLAYLCCLLVVLVFSAACGAAGGVDSGANSGGAAYIEGAATPAPEAPEAVEVDYQDGLLALEDSARKVIRRVYMSLETEDFQQTITALEQKVVASGGYIEQLETQAATAYSSSWAMLVLRLPVAVYGEFKLYVEGLGEVISATESGEDVTGQYYDTESRLKLLRAQEERIFAFIAQAKNIEEVFIIEDELTRIRTEIEQLTTLKKRLDGLTSLATVTLEVREIGDNALAAEKDRFGLRFAQAWDGSLRGIVTVSQGLVLLVVRLWPLLVLAVAALLICWRLRQRRRRRLSSQKTAPAPELSEDDAADS